MLLLCLDRTSADRVMREVHAGVCGPHMGGHMLAMSRVSIHGDLIHVPPLELHALTSPWPFSVWGIDIIGKISPKSSNGHEFILVAIDYFTKWFHRSHIICRYGVPHEPQTNGAVEAANKNIKRILRRMVETSRDWSEKLPFALWAYRTSFRTSTGATPYSLVYGMEAVLPVEIEMGSLRVVLEQQIPEADWAQARFDQLNLLDERRLRAADHVRAYQRKMARAFKKRVRPRPLRIGDLVLKVIRGLIRDPRGKFRPNWSGPYFIRELTPEGAAWLMDLDGNRFSEPTNVDQLKKTDSVVFGLPGSRGHGRYLTEPLRSIQLVPHFSTLGCHHASLREVILDISHLVLLTYHTSDVILGHTPILESTRYFTFFSHHLIHIWIFASRHTGAYPLLAPFVWGNPPLSFTFGASPHCHFVWGNPPLSFTFGASPHYHFVWGIPHCHFVWGIPHCHFVRGIPPLSFTFGASPQYFAWGILIIISLRHPLFSSCLGLSPAVSLLRAFPFSIITFRFWRSSHHYFRFGVEPSSLLDALSHHRSRHFGVEPSSSIFVLALSHHRFEPSLSSSLGFQSSVVFLSLVFRVGLVIQSHKSWRSYPLAWRILPSWFYIVPRFFLTPLSCAYRLFASWDGVRDGFLRKVENRRKGEKKGEAIEKGREHIWEGASKHPERFGMANMNFFI
ncbi:hypothetical protein AAG906_026474 [Vitis piasezkii]